MNRLIVIGSKMLAYCHQIYNCACKFVFLFRTSWVKYDSILYKVPCVLVSKIEEEWPQFVLLKEIYVTDGNYVFFFVQLLSTVTFNHHYHAYIIRKTHHDSVTSPNELHSPFPLHLHTFDDNEILLGVVLKYHLTGCLM